MGAAFLTKTIPELNIKFEIWCVRPSWRAPRAPCDAAAAGRRRGLCGDALQPRRGPLLSTADQVGPLWPHLHSGGCLWARRGPDHGSQAEPRSQRIARSRIAPRPTRPSPSPLPQGHCRAGAVPQPSPDVLQVSDRSRPRPRKQSEPVVRPCWPRTFTQLRAPRPQQLLARAAPLTGPPPHLGPPRRGAAAAIIVYDITSTDSFNRAKAWVRELQRQGSPNMIMALAGGARAQRRARAGGGSGGGAGQQRAVA